MKNQFRMAFTFIEVLTVATILALVIGMGFIHYRSTASSGANMAVQIGFRMVARQATDLLSDCLLDGTEIIQPMVGASSAFFTMKNVRNQIQLFYLRKSKTEANAPNELVTYVDRFTGIYQQNDQQVLFGKVKDIFFTSTSPGMVVVHLTMTDGKTEVSSLFQVPLKNIGSTDE
ncbi:MAG: hypothetical protein HQM08_28750 [Candidatus Riflebacteria bacterium]|nr:hypothetical protein [Candidatus Riflebacteria bacterium]